MRALEIRDLTKTYANGIQALKGIDLDVEEGEFCALLGPNGAGKTTTIGILTSLVTKTSGKVRIFGYDTDTDLALAKSCLGLVPQEINLNLFEKVLNIVVTQAGYYGIPRRVALDRAERYLSQLHLWDRRDSIARSLSGGMKRRLMIARALIHEPRLLILDDATSAVDPSKEHEIRDALTGAMAGRTNLVIAHRPATVALADRVVPSVVSVTIKDVQDPSERRRGMPRDPFQRRGKIWVVNVITYALHAAIRAEVDVGTRS
mgnify:CR=1 FL=1